MDDARLKELDTKYKIRLQIADQALRDREIRLKEQTSWIDKLANPLTVGIIVGALGLVGTFINGLVANLNEQTKLQNDLIKEAIKPASEQERAKSLVFFAKNRLISLEPDVVESLVGIAGSAKPVPGSSGVTSSAPRSDFPVSYSQEIVDGIRQRPGVPYPSGVTLKRKSPDSTILAIILHTAAIPDSAVSILRSGTPALLGPLAHWAVQTDGSIAFIADETQKASHIGRSDKGVANSNTIAIEATGIPAFSGDRQVESLVRLVADVAERWEIPTKMIFGHAEVAVPAGSRSDMLQQAPAIREMVDAVRKK